MDAMNDIKGIRRGQIKIGASTIPGEFILPLFIGQFKQRFPEIKVVLEIANTEQVVDWLQNGRIDLGVIGARVRAKQLDLKPFLNDELLLIAPAGHPLTNRETVHPPDLVHEQFVMREQGSGTRLVVQERLAQAGLNFNDLKVVMELGSSRAVITAVEAGMGLSFVSGWSVTEALALGRLRAIRVAGLELHRPLYVATLPRNYSCPLTQSLLELLLDPQIQEKIKMNR
jgi:DNA-binding transcriptional LysR family regulator